MTPDEKLMDYSRQRLSGRDVPADLRPFSCCSGRGRHRRPAPRHGSQLLDAGEAHPLSTTYINDKDRVDPDTMANVAAMRARANTRHSSRTTKMTRSSAMVRAEDLALTLLPF